MLNHVAAVLLIMGMLTMGVNAQTALNSPVKVIFDTDIGDDIDDALALAMIHALVDRSEIELLAITISKDNKWSAVYTDIINRFYGRPDISIGVVKNGKRPKDGYSAIVGSRKANGEFVYPRGLQSGTDAPEAVDLIRKALAREPDGSVVMLSVGPMTNMARLLQSKPDKHSALNGIELVERKIKCYVAMAGEFRQSKPPEFNIIVDITAAQVVFDQWPTPIAVSGFDVGKMVLYPAESIEKDFGYVDNHPVAEAYREYAKMPYDRPTWDLSVVLYAARPDRDYFDMSEAGNIVVDDKGVTHFTKTDDGKHRYFVLPAERCSRVLEAYLWLVSAPPRIQRLANGEICQ